MKKAAASYNTKPSEFDDPRTIEAWALTEASRRLVLAASGTAEELHFALHLNQRLWSIFQASLADPANPLPKEIRDNVLALSIIVDRHLLKRLADLDGTKIQPILDINRSIAEGLKLHSSSPPPETAGEQPFPSSANISV